MSSGFSPVPLAKYASPDHAAKEAWKDIPEWVRQAVLDRDNAQCQLCGTGGENRLALHHIEYRSQGGTHQPQNLVTLCFRCHDDVHHGRIDVFLIELAPGEWAAFPSMDLYYPTRPRQS